MPGVITRPFAPERSRFNRGEQPQGGAAGRGGGSAERPRTETGGGSAERLRTDSGADANRPRPDANGASGVSPAGPAGENT